MAGIADLVTVPRRAGRAHLAYITEAEAAHLRRANIGGADPAHRTYRGPGGLPRLDDDGGGGGASGGGNGGGPGGGDAGGGPGADAGGGSTASGAGDASGAGVGAGAGANGGGPGGQNAGVSGGLGDSETGQTGGGGFGSSTGSGTLGGGMDDAATATSGISFGPEGGMNMGAPGVEAGYGPNAVSATGLDPGLGGMPGVAGPAPEGTNMADKSNAPTSSISPGFAGIAAAAAGMLGGFPASVATTLGLNALGLTSQQSTGAMLSGAFGGLVGSAFGGPVGGLVGSALGSIAAGSLEAHGTNGDAPGGTGTGHGGAGGGNSGGITTLLARGGRVAGPATGRPDRLATGSGLVPGLGLGRADTVPATLPRGSYVLPADVVSGLGQGNTAAGAMRIGAALKGLPRFSTGGRVQMVPARLSGGEYVVHPAHVTAIGMGSISAGSRKLDAVVQRVRASTVRATLRALPPRGAAQ